MSFFASPGWPLRSSGSALRSLRSLRRGCGRVPTGRNKPSGRSEPPEGAASAVASGLGVGVGRVIGLEDGGGGSKNGL